MATQRKKNNPLPTLTPDTIFIKGARVHNLKNIDVSIPKNKLIVVTGVSGSGKSSLTMDTLFAEGQRRYAESLSAYSRQFLMRRDKPDVDYINGICPAIAIEQKVSSRSPRSTVGSMTEIADYLRLLYAKIGKTYSPISGNEVKKDQVSDVVDFINQLADGSKIHLLIPLQIRQDRVVVEELTIYLQKGFSRLYHTKHGVIRVEDYLEKPPQKKMVDTYLLIDRLVKKTFDEADMHRLADSVQTAFSESNGDCWVAVEGQNIKIFNNRFEADGLLFNLPTPHFFSSNNPFGTCPTCEGYGTVLGTDAQLVIPNPQLSVYEGAVACWKGEKSSAWQQEFIYKAAVLNFPIHKPVAALSPTEYELLWKGNATIKGIDAFFEMVANNVYKIQYRILQARYRGKTVCPACKGNKLRKEALYVKINDTTIAQLLALPAVDLYQWISTLQLTPTEQEISNRLLVEISNRLKTLLAVGLNYLTLDRVANTLSGGESQRIQLTKFLGSNLTDSAYILDEPSIGLHPRDTHQLIKVLQELRDLGNTVIVVEHDEMLMRAADHIIDMGPLASYEGGEVIATGTADELINNPNSLTGKYLSGQLTVSSSSSIRPLKNEITLVGCTQNNLKNLTVSFPLNRLCVVSGISGSGKTTLVKQTLYPALLHHFGESSDQVKGKFTQIKGNLNAIKGVAIVDQNPIGKSSRSNPVTYIKAYEEIRQLFASLPLAKQRGYSAGYFSFNTDGGRCDTCKGDGEVIVEMQFLADVHLVCESCKGQRFKEALLEITFKEKNIADVLEMSVDQAIHYFSDQPKIRMALQPLADVGLGYVKLGQSSTTLSGGEAQRVKLASFLGKGALHDKMLFIFDEPTTGLHFHDINKLLASFQALIDKGHSLIVIEHHTDIIKNADWIIDMGPEGGAGGGNILFEGTAKDLMKSKKSITAQYL